MTRVIAPCEARDLYVRCEMVCLQTETGTKVLPFSTISIGQVGFISNLLTPVGSLQSKSIPWLGFGLWTVQHLQEITTRQRARDWLERSDSPGYT